MLTLQRASWEKFGICLPRASDCLASDCWSNFRLTHYTSLHSSECPNMSQQQTCEEHLSTHSPCLFWSHVADDRLVGHGVLEPTADHQKSAEITGDLALQRSAALRPLEFTNPGIALASQRLRAALKMRKRSHITSHLMTIHDD